MPAYNSSHYISESIESVLNQSYENWELLIIDDGSTDSLKDTILDFLSDERIKYIYQDNSGVTVARNKGISLSSGEYMAFLDSDDMWTNDKLSRVISAFEEPSNENVGIIHSSYYTFSEDISKTSLAAKYSRYNDSALDSLYVLNNIGTLTAVLRKSVIDDVGVFDESFLGAEDWDLWLRIIEKYSVRLIDEPLAFYRVHNMGLSKNKDVFFKEERRVLLKHSQEKDVDIIKAAKLVQTSKELIHDLKRFEFKNCISNLFFVFREGLARPSRGVYLLNIVWQRIKK